MSAPRVSVKYTRSGVRRRRTLVPCTNVPRTRPQHRIFRSRVAAVSIALSCAVSFSLVEDASAQSIPSQEESPWLGVALENGKVGALIKSVDVGSPAEVAGLEAGDEITSVDDIPTTIPADVFSIVLRIPVGRRVRVNVERGGKAIKRTVRLAARPDLDEMKKRAREPAAAAETEALECRSDNPLDPGVGIGGDIVFLVPIGAFADNTGPQLGPLLHIVWPAARKLELTMRGGYLFGFPKTVGTRTSASVDIAVLTTFGARYFFTARPLGFYGAGEIGANLFSPQSNVGNSELLFRLGTNFGVGYVISKHLPLDFRGQLSVHNLLGQKFGEATWLSIGVSAGYMFY